MMGQKRVFAFRHAAFREQIFICLMQVWVQSLYKIFTLVNVCWDTDTCFGNGSKIVCGVDGYVVSILEILKKGRVDLSLS